VKTYGGVEVYLRALTSALDGGEWSVSCSVPFNTVRDLPVLIGYEAGWTTEPVWTRWRREFLLCPRRVSNPGHPALSSVTVLTEIHRPVR